MAFAGRKISKLFTAYLAAGAAVFAIGCKSNSTTDQLAQTEKPEAPPTQVISFVTVTSNQIMIKGGTTTAIEWPLLDGQSGVLSLYGSTNGGTTWQLLEPYVANTGYFSFNAPRIDSTDYILKVVDGSTIVAISESIHVISTGPKLKSDKFASQTVITTAEMTSYMTSTYDPPANPSLNGRTWTIDFSNYVDAPIGFTVSSPISHSQYGGPISCANQVCTFQAPVAVATSDELQFYFVDSVGNQSPLIHGYVDLTVGSLNSNTGIGQTANIINADTTDYLAKVSALVAGDVLVLASGVYPSATLTALNGTPSQPIVIVSQDRATPAVFRSGSGNLVNIENSSYVVFRHLKFDGQNNNTSDGIKTNSGSATTQHISIENCEFVNFQGGSTQTAINTKATALNWSIIGNKFTDVTKAMSLGSSSGPFLDGLIELNYAKNFTDSAIHIVSHSTRPVSSEIPITQTKNIIRNNSFAKVQSGNFPIILLGGQPESGTGSYDYNEVYANFLYDNAADTAFIQATGKVSIHHNIIAKGSTTNTSNIGIKLLDFDGLHLRIAHVFQNTVVGSYVGIRQHSNATIESKISSNLVLANNTAINTSGTSASPNDNISDLFSNASNYLVDATTASITAFDAYPKSGMASGAAVNLVPFKTNGYSMSSSIDYDFNGYTNKNTFRGAYSGEASNPGWKLALSIKAGGAFPTVGDIVGPPPLILATDANGASDIDLDPAGISCPVTAPSGRTFRICNSEDVRTICQGANVFKPLSVNTTIETTNLQNWLNNKMDGDVIEVVYSATATNNLDPNKVKNQFTACDLAVQKNNLTFRGICGPVVAVNRPTFAYDISKCPASIQGSGMGMIINQGDNNRFINLNFSKAKVSAASGGDAAAIVDEGKNLVVAHSVFYSNNNGIISSGANLVNDPERSSTVFITNSMFERNGVGTPKTTSNGISIGKGTTHLVIKNSLFLRQQEKGDELESRAQQTTMQCSVVSGRDPLGSNDTEKRFWQDDALLSFPSGGKVKMFYNSIYKGSNPTNGYQFVNFNSENEDPSTLNYYQDFNINNNYIHNRMTSGVSAYFLNYNQRDAGRYTAKTSLTFKDNLFYSLGTSYLKTNFFNLLSGIDLSFDVANVLYGNQLLVSAVIPTLTDVAIGAQFVATPGNDPASVAAEALVAGDGEIAAQAHCPGFTWIRRF